MYVCMYVRMHACMHAYIYSSLPKSIIHQQIFLYILVPGFIPQTVLGCGIYHICPKSYYYG